jgi:hypothetical protein
MNADDSEIASTGDLVATVDLAGAPSAGSPRPGGTPLEIGAILVEAWRRTRGSKRVILGAGLINFAISLASNGAGGAASSVGGSDELMLLSLLLSLAGMAVNYGINAGTWIYAIKRASGDGTASFGDVFSRLSRLGSLFMLMLVNGVLVFIGFVLLIVPGVYLALGYMLALPVMAERGTGIWESLEISRKAIQRRWFSVLALVLVTGAVLCGGALITLGIGLIWLWPWVTMVFAILYRELLGTDPRA